MTSNSSTATPLVTQAMQMLQKNDAQQAWQLLQEALENARERPEAVHMGFAMVYEKQFVVEKVYGACAYVAQQFASQQGAQSAKGIMAVLAQQPVGEERALLEALCELARFAYARFGPHFRMQVVREKVMFGLSSRQKVQTTMLWDTKIEGLTEIDGDGFKGERSGATLEVFAPVPFLVRVTHLPSGMYDLALWKRIQIPGVPQETYAKQKQHAWQFPQAELPARLEGLVKDGVLQWAAGVLSYP